MLSSLVPASTQTLPLSLSLFIINKWNAKDFQYSVWCLVSMHQERRINGIGRWNSLNNIHFPCHPFVHAFDCIGHPVPGPGSSVHLLSLGLFLLLFFPTVLIIIVIVCPIVPSCHIQRKTVFEAIYIYIYVLSSSQFVFGRSKMKTTCAHNNDDTHLYVNN